IKLAIHLTTVIDKIKEINDETVQRERLMQLKPEFDMMLNSVINEKMHMGWPAAKRNLRIFPLFKAAILESINIRR
ncbi:MAG: hypothetical protein QMD80_00795, partial [archaeon]|nr:hypothetical protein [archaeon]